MAGDADPVDAFLERLDAALSARAARGPQSSAGATPPAPVTPPPAPEPSLVAEAFAALLALEEGDAAARPVRLVTATGIRITDALVDELAKRVAERLKGTSG